MNKRIEEVISKHKEYAKILEFLLEEEFSLKNSESEIEALSKDKKCKISLNLAHTNSYTYPIFGTLGEERISYRFEIKYLSEFKEVLSLRNELITKELIDMFKTYPYFNINESSELFLIRNNQVFSLPISVCFKEFLCEIIVVFDVKPKLLLKISRFYSSSRKDLYKELLDSSPLAKKFFSNKDVVFSFPENAFPTKAIGNSFDEEEIREIMGR